jgi:hypothetical protein
MPSKPLLVRAVAVLVGLTGVVWSFESACSDGNWVTCVKVWLASGALIGGAIFPWWLAPFGAILGFVLQFILLCLFLLVHPVV